MNEVYLTPDEVSQRYNGKITTRTLSNWRSGGGTLPFVKIGGRVLYPLSKVVEWEAKRTVSSTSEYKR
jgi:hypothetical protein